MTELRTKDELLAALKDTHDKVTKWFESIHANEFFTRTTQQWSASDNMDHLIRSHKSLIKALKLPQPVLRTMFGKPDKPSLNYAEICSVYRAKIAQGGVASGSYLPDQQHPDDTETTKRDILARWATISSEFIALMEKWDEPDLDLYQIPHPLLGNLTIREMLFFMNYHDLRHASLEGD